MISPNLRVPYLHKFSLKKTVMEEGVKCFRFFKALYIEVEFTILWSLGYKCDSSNFSVHLVLNSGGDFPYFKI